MNKKVKIILSAAGFVLFIAAAVLAYNTLSDRVEREVPTQSDSDEEQRVRAADFVMNDREGRSIRLSEIIARGQPTVINFWASWCPSCRDEMPAFDEVYKELGSQVQFVMLNLADGVRETVETGTALIDEGGYSFPLFFDVEGEAANAYEVRFLPTTVFINSDGYVVTTLTGRITQEQLRGAIDLAKGE